MPKCSGSPAVMRCSRINAKIRAVSLERKSLQKYSIRSSPCTTHSSKSNSAPSLSCSHLARAARSSSVSGRLEELPEVAQRLAQLEFHVFGQAADIVVRLDGVGFFGFRARAFDNVGVDGALRQPFGVSEFFLFCIKYFDELKGRLLVSLI